MSEVTIYRLRVELTQVPYEDGEGVWRVIEVKGSQTLDQLHRAIFKAFNRWEEHLYSFYLSKNRKDVSQEYASPYLFEEDEEGEQLPHDAASVRLDSLGLTTGSTFDYMFDYGDDWEHKLEVLHISDEKPTGRYPRIVEKHGASPPQYPERDDVYDDEPDEPARGGRRLTRPRATLPSDTKRVASRPSTAQRVRRPQGPPSGSLVREAAYAGFSAFTCARTAAGSLYHFAFSSV